SRGPGRGSPSRRAGSPFLSSQHDRIAGAPLQLRANSIFHVPLMSQLVDLYGLTRAEIDALFESWGLSLDHAARLWRELYWECAESVAAMTALPLRVRARISAGHR